MSLSRLAKGAVVLIAASAATACGKDSTAPTVNPILGASASVAGSSAVTVAFTTYAGDNSYLVERAEGAAGAFAADTTIAAPAAATPLSYRRGGLKPLTLYRFRITSTRGGQSSIPSSELTVTTANVGTAAADITADIAASRTLFADTVYTLNYDLLLYWVQMHTQEGEHPSSDDGFRKTEDDFESAT